MSFRPTARLAVAAAVLALAALPLAPAAGQAPVGTPSPRPADGYTQAFAANILAFPFGLFSAEYEHALVWTGFSFGIGGSILAEGDSRDNWASAKLLYYPNERTFRGFSVGLTAGVHSARDTEDTCTFEGCTTANGERQTAPTLGVIVNYDWLLGRAERFRVGAGVGAKRVLKNVDSEDALLQIYPDGRFVVGIAF